VLDTCGTTFGQQGKN
jgi:hypothetical protein